MNEIENRPFYIYKHTINKNKNKIIKLIINYSWLTSALGTIAKKINIEILHWKLMKSVTLLK